MHKKKRGALAIISLVVIAGFLVFILRLAPLFIGLLFHKDIELKKTEDRINVLMLGIGGGKHDGPLLTDTILYASIDQKTHKITLVSLPRDLWIPDLQAKINTAYAYGEEKRKGGGLLLAKAVVEKATGQPVDYVTRVDFNGFVRAIDQIGGLDINVERSFEDYEYPISGKETDTCGFEGEEFEKKATASSVLESFPCRFEHVSFEQELQHMDGETALKYVRSRHARGIEGTDFARSQRQEKVIEAFKAKLLSLGTLANPGRLISLYNVVKDSIDTDIKENEYDDFIKLAQEMKDAKMQSVVFFYTSEREAEQGILINPRPSSEFRGQWVIVPRIGNGNFSEIHSLVECEIKNDDCPTLKGKE